MIYNRQAATAAIQSLQYINNNTKNSTTTLSHGEEIALIAEIRTFISTLGSDNTLNNNRVDSLDSIINQLTKLGNVILEPLLINKVEVKASTTTSTNNNKKKRYNTYILPLELIPTILATLDILTDRKFDLHIKEEVEKKSSSMVIKKNDDDNVDVVMNDVVMNDNDEYEQSSPDDVKDRGEIHQERASDKLLLSMFTSSNSNTITTHNKFQRQRTIRAEALLPLLSLAIDDIGINRMLTTTTTILDNDEEEITYLDYLKIEIGNVIYDNLICYSDLNNDNVDGLGSSGGVSDTNQLEQRQQQHQVIDEGISNEGIHIIPTSDYPALMRCIFRMMVSTSCSSATTTSSDSWESILLQLYHATSVATNQRPFSSRPDHHRRMSLSGSGGGADRLALLSTVESHVLLPSFTGASVDTVKSILESCDRECCLLCNQDGTIMEESSGVAASQQRVVPAWAVAGVVLLIMRARSSSSNHSGITSANNGSVVGPRAVFRMASAVLQRVSHEHTSSDANNSSVGGADDEIGYALKLLLRLSSVREEDVSYSNIIGGKIEQSAYSVLKCCYYAGNDKFHNRYNATPDNNNNDLYQHDLGLHTLSSYSNLVRTSLNHGANHDTWEPRSIDSSKADSAKIWIDAANMILDDHGSRNSNDSNDGTAMAIVAIVVVFFEVPSSRDDIVRSIYNRLANMTCHNSHAAGKQSEVACFLIISMLAWSLVANDDKCLTNNIVRRKDRRDHVTAVLEPLCNLLSKSSLSSDTHSGSGEAPKLSYWALSRLASALAPIPSGREAILAMAQKNMRALSVSSPYAYSSSTNLFETLPTAPRKIDDDIYLSIHCLLVLVEICHTSSQSVIEDDCGQRALMMIADFIVLQRPSSLSISSTTSRVPINIISWMLNELSKSSQGGKLTKWVSHRLLRACFVSLLNCIALEDSESFSSSSLVTKSIFSVGYSSSSSRMIQKKIDFPGTLRLAICLYNDIISDKSNGSVMQNESQKLLSTHLLRTLLSQPPPDALDETNQNDSIDSLFNDIYRAVQAGFNPSDSDLALDEVLLMIILQGTARMIQLDESPSSSDGVDDTNETLKELVRYVADSEAHHLQGEGQKHGSSLPSWIQDKSLDDTQNQWQMDEELKACTQLKHFQESLCDILVDVLLRNETSCESSNQDKSILLGVNHVLGCKRRLSSSEIILGSVSHKSTCQLIDLASHRLRPLLTSKEKKMSILPEVDVLVKNALDFCKISKRTLLDSPSQSRMLHSCWSIYCSLADEESSQLLISFVKESCVEKGGWSGQEMNPNDIETSFSLVTIASSEDLDFHIRYMRETILMTLSQILNSVSSLHTDSSPQERKENLDLMLLLLPQLCQDLDASFHGYSGGLQKRLMLCFLDAIEECVDAISILFESISVNTQRQISSAFSSVHQAAEILWEILRENPLRLASVVKNSLGLCIDKMPRLVQRVERLVDECIIDKVPSEHTCELLEQCSVQLKSKAVEMKSQKPEALALSDRGEKESSTSNDEFLLSSKKDSEVDESKTDGGKGIGSAAQTHSITTMKTLPWVCNCSITALTNMWNDSYQIILGSDKSTTMHMVKSPGDKPLTLAKRRIDGFSRLHISLCRMFQVHQNESKAELGNNADEEPTSTILAEYLSYYGKSNMCSCIEKVAVTLVLAFKQVIKYFNDLRPITTQSLYNDSKLKESLICIIGWLQSVKSNETPQLDVITGTISWYIHEKRNIRLSSFGKDGYPILGRLPKVLLKLDGLEAEVQKLDAILAADFGCMGDESSSSQRLLNFEEVLSTLISRQDNNEQNTQTTFRGLLRQCIENVDSSKRILKASDAGDNLLSDEDSDSDTDADEEEFTAAGKRQMMRRYTPMRKSHRVSLRSRNDTIDNWLTQDDDEFATTPGEKYNTNDAFVDLEDFLVEG